jgi:hypothetical protein
METTGHENGREQNYDNLQGVMLGWANHLVRIKYLVEYPKEEIKVSVKLFALLAQSSACARASSPHLSAPVFMLSK